ncbi:hypothetical protein [Pelagicoccus mobilis]|uniref:Cytochrome c domain-containing protein n=1 Tax=Pelagicoccus mobilis TaxID=415221 RepID=A0A934RW12_9BACT|nr:hypothetical protein [Pelagicoccus mobilis]MBK1876194.1 hypothetical protein [Pelagicoccus mobilis]
MLKFALLTLLLPASLLAQKFYDQEPINYESDLSPDSVSSYFAQTGNLKTWEHAGPSGYLRSFLDAFDIPVESQVLVFSKTSLQADRISPQTPRAIYFNDEMYVGWVPGGSILEISVANPKVGTNFYTLNNDQQSPQLLRETDDCLRCHGESFTREVPGHVIRSVFPSESGHPIFKAGSRTVDHTTPFEKRWGGWIVTGTDQEHFGNKLYQETADGASISSHHILTNVPENGYLAPSSDVVALLVLEHQAHAHTLIAKLAINTQRALHDQKILDELLKREAPLSDSTIRRIKHTADELLSYLFFTDEARIPRIDLAPSNFAQAFQDDRPADPHGRSLYQLRMNRRMFRYQLSYLVYSQAMLQLPTEAQDYLWPELKRILNSDVNESGYTHISQNQKRDILEILLATHPRFQAP